MANNLNNRMANAIIQIRMNKDVPEAMTDDEIAKLIPIGDSLRAGMVPDVEVEYDELQQLAIVCSTAYEIANDEELGDFDFEEFDAQFEKEFG